MTERTRTLQAIGLYAVLLVVFYGLAFVFGFDPVGVVAGGGLFLAVRHLVEHG